MAFLSTSVSNLVFLQYLMRVRVVLARVLSAYLYKKIPSQIRPTLNFSSTSRLPEHIINTSFFDSDLQELDEHLGPEVYSFLPSLPEANALCRVYLEHAAYL